MTVQERNLSLTVIEGAFKNFEALMHSSDRQLFRSTTIEQVREAARIIERDQAQRKTLRNLRRIEPLLNGLSRFSAAIDTLCQGTPFLPYLWVSIALRSFDRIAESHRRP